MQKHIQQQNIGLLGGGQLGRMLLQEAANWDLKIAVLDPNEYASCRNFTHEFVRGDFRDFQTVYDFGKGRDLVTIEFEDVNSDALEALEKNGVKVYPQPKVLKIIQDKGLQKQFFLDHNIPTSGFYMAESLEEIKGGSFPLPAFQKLRKSGYDGYGVKRLNSSADFEKAFDEPSVIEEMVEIKKELSVIVARNESGEMAHFPVVELVFHPEANMVQYLFAPADIDPFISEEAVEIASKLMRELNMTGILAVEMFLTRHNKLLVNEIAPRPHNSGHHTIEANKVSQYEQHLRAILNLPLGDTTAISHAAMVNILGSKDHSGTPVYIGLEKVLEIPGAYIHLYGKSQTRPFRKMGHVTILDKDPDDARIKAVTVQIEMSVVSEK